MDALVAEPEVTGRDGVEHTGLAGTAVSCAAAKNFAAVTVRGDSGDYTRALEEMAADGGVHDDRRFSLGRKACEHTAWY